MIYNTVVGNYLRLFIEYAGFVPFAAMMQWVFNT